MVGLAGGVRVGFNDALTLEVAVNVALSCIDGLVKRATRFCRQNVFSGNKSIVAVQHALLTRNGILPRNTDRKSILLWVNNFRASGSVSKKRDEAQSSNFRKNKQCKIL